ncbi:MAG: hypothetical protein ACRCVV_09095 [Shewanella sp.]
MSNFYIAINLLVLTATLTSCSQYAVINSDDIEIPENSAGHYFIQKALDDDWFAYVKSCDNGAISIEIIGEESFISNLDKGSFCEKIGGIWNEDSCLAKGILIYTSPEMTEKPKKIFQLYQKGAMQSCQQWREAAESIALNSQNMGSKKL